MPPKRGAFVDPGAHLPLNGVTMVFTGEFEAFSKEQMIDMAKTKGAKITGAVSARTDYLVCGHILVDQRPTTESSKYKKMLELKNAGKNGPKEIWEKEFLELLGDSTADTPTPPATPSVAPSTSLSFATPRSRDPPPASTPVTPAQSFATARSTGAASTPVSTPVSSPSTWHTTPSQTPTSTITSSPSQSYLMTPSMAETPSMSSRAGGLHTKSASVKAGEPGQPWVNKYCPRTIDDLVGNGSVTKKLLEWLRDWDDVVLRNMKKKAPMMRGQAENINARCVLLSGPPGIGKSTAARLIALSLDKYKVQEYNASDARGKKIIEEMEKGIADNMTLEFAKKGQLSTKSKMTGRPLIIMDEVDGMGAGDRGGAQALAKMIKVTRNPMICICNDRSNPKMRTLGNHCYDLRFQRPTKTSIAQRCAEICRLEGLVTDMNALEGLAEASGNDIRNVITQLQFLSNQSKDVSFGNVKDQISDISKDLDITAFEAARRLLSTAEMNKMKFNEKMELFFTDYDLMPLLIQENYMRAVAESRDPHIIHKAATAADAILMGDIISAKLRSTNNWSLLPDVGFMSSVYPSQLCNGFMGNPTFPAYLGKNSSATKSKRLAKELHSAMWAHSTCPSKNLVSSGYLDLIYTDTLKVLKGSDSDKIPKACEMLDSYQLSKEHLAEHIADLRKPFFEFDDFKLLDSNVKTALTKEFNSGKYTTRFAMVKKQKRERGEGGLGNDDEEEEKVEQSSDEEGEDLNALVKASKATAKSKAKAKAKPFPFPATKKPKVDKENDVIEI